MYANLAVLAVFAFFYCVTSRGLAKTPFNGAIIFTFFGLVTSPLAGDILHLNIETENIRLLAELTLALVLFSDAANANLSVLKKNYRIPEYLLLIGLPLTIALGFLTGIIFFPGCSFLEILILAAILAPTDAALGSAVVSDQRVPAPVREGLNIESGLNDGICVPVLLTLLALATEKAGSDQPFLLAVEYALEEIGIGMLVGASVTLVGALLLKASIRFHLINEIWLELPVITLSMACFSIAQVLGGSGFIAAFCGGLVFGGLPWAYKEEHLKASEAAGNALSLLTWVIFGTAVISKALGSFTWQTLVYALLSLTIVRMLPIYLSLGKSGLSKREKLFIGWFGPRGLATVVFGVMVANADLPHGETIVMTAVCCIVLSIILHGITANPLIAILARQNKK
ncbi:cation:proton antiporter [Desulfogranum japonicum]|uniref:cation:proton antiporter n=1 Tax=Desulfogranum japonicum TaxID=231447 RepID=UPI0003F9F7FD|nr:cation:proton antiporter [Desulfogranum japonicum]